MTMLPALPVILLGLVMAWFIWPIVADPIARRRAARVEDSNSDDLFRILAKRTGPKRDLMRAERG